MKGLFAALLFCTLAVAQAVPPTFFGLHWQNNSPWPAVPFGALRMWDTGTRWQQLEPQQNQYTWGTLDAYLAQAKQHGMTDLLLTLSSTPKWASIDPTNANCDYHTTQTGSCGPPLMLNADGTGLNQYWRDYVYNLAAHLKSLDPATYQPIKYFAGWNEFSRATQSWTGSPAQLARMMQDANCIITGRGTIAATHEACTAAAMKEPAVGVLPSARMATADSVLTAPDSSLLKAYYASSGAVAAADSLAAHAYVQNGSCCAVGETIANRGNTFASIAPASAAGLEKWSTEGSWGQNNPNLADPDMQAAFVVRYYMVGWSSGFRRLYWYAYNNQSWGTLWNPSGVNGCTVAAGCLTKAGKAYASVYNWMVGSTLTKPCSAAGTIWTCQFDSAMAVWDTSQGCSSGTCAGSMWTYPGTYGQYMTLDSGTPIALTSSQVKIGAKPILLMTAGRVSPAPPTNFTAIPQ